VTPPVTRRYLATLGTVAVVLALVGSITLVSGRIREMRGLGYDGKIYAAMMVEGLDSGTPNTRMRPLVILTNQLAYDFVFHEPIRTFRAMNVVYTALLAIVLCAILDVYGASAGHKLAFCGNVFATIAVSKMFAFYPVLVDLGAYVWVSLAVYAILRWRRPAIVFATVCAVFAREFALVAVLFGVHRDIRRGAGWWRTVATYAPALVAFAALRQWVRATTDTAAGLTGVQGGLLSGADVVSNFGYLANPVFVAVLAYFVATVFGGISLMLIVNALRRRGTIGEETEWVTYLAATLALAVVGNADLWRYLAYALPAAAALYGRSFAADDWRMIAPWAGLVTVFSQQPWMTMDEGSYFTEWFPLYLPIFHTPSAPTPEFWLGWSVRIAVVAMMGVAAWAALGKAPLARMAAAPRAQQLGA